MSAVTESIASFPQGEKWSEWAPSDKKNFKELIKKIGFKGDGDKKPKKTRSPSGYNLFNRSQFSTIKDEMPEGSSHQDAVKEVANRWKEMSEEDKKEWLEKALEAKHALSDAESQSSGKSSKRKSRLPSGYNLFNKAQFQLMKEEMDGVDGAKINAREILSAIAAKWKSLSDAEKKEYNDKANEAKAAAAEDSGSETSGAASAKSPYKLFKKTNMANFKKILEEKSGGPVASTDITKALKNTWEQMTKDEKAAFDVCGSPKSAKKSGVKRARTAYNFFSKEHSAEVKKGMEASGSKVSQTDVMKTIASAWKSMSEEDKEPYNKMAAADKLRVAESA